MDNFFITTFFYKSHGSFWTTLCFIDSFKGFKLTQKLRGTCHKSN